MYYCREDVVRLFLDDTIRVVDIKQLLLLCEKKMQNKLFLLIENRLVIALAKTCHSVSLPIALLMTLTHML